MISAFFKDTIVVQRRVETLVSGELVISYETVNTVKGCARNVVGNSRQGVNKTVAECDYRFYLPIVNVLITDRIYFDNRYFNIGAINNVQSMNEHLQIDAAEIK